MEALKLSIDNEAQAPKGKKATQGCSWSKGNASADQW
jgi:hypothetical protein